MADAIGRFEVAVGLACKLGRLRKSANSEHFTVASIRQTETSHFHNPLPSDKANVDEWRFLWRSRVLKNVITLTYA